MEIIKPGTVPKKTIPKLRGTCGNCGCIVECLPTDPAVLPYPRTNPIFKIMCPTTDCNFIIKLEDYVTRIS